MKRRDSLKALLIGTVGGSTLPSLSSCQPETTEEQTHEAPLYGRTPEELEHDDEVKAEIYLNEYELGTIAVLCDIILPATADAGSATEAEVPAFIEFIVKDIPKHQIPIRGGLMWVNSEAYQRFDKDFVSCLPEEQIQIIEDIAYPDPEEKKPEMAYGIKFFNLMRNLTLTGYYTTKMGFEDLGVTSNFANTWDGVPSEVLANHDVDYDPEWLAKCIDQSKRMEIAKWDEEGNLLT